MFTILDNKVLTKFTEDEKARLLEVFAITIRSVFGINELAFEIDGIEHTALYEDDTFIHRTYQLKEGVKDRVGRYNAFFKGIRFFATKEIGLLEDKEVTLYHAQMSYIGGITPIGEVVPTIPNIVEVTEFGIKDVRLITPLRNMAERYIPPIVWQNK